MAKKHLNASQALTIIDGLGILCICVGPNVPAYVSIDAVPPKRYELQAPSCLKYHTLMTHEQITAARWTMDSDLGVTYLFAELQEERRVLTFRIMRDTNAVRVPSKRYAEEEYPIEEEA